MPDGQGKFDGSTIEDNSKVADIEPCPSCGALPCDWCKNPWKVMTLTTEQAISLGRKIAEATMLPAELEQIHDIALEMIGRIAFKVTMELAKDRVKSANT